MKFLKDNRVNIVFVSVVFFVICIIAVFFWLKSGENNIDNYSDFYNENMVSNLSENSGVNEKNIDKNNEKMYVHIVGEVINQGVYILESGDRIIDIIDKAGGITENADLGRVNLAYKLSDGQKIYIPNVNEKNEDIHDAVIDDNCLYNSVGENNKKININSANANQLETIVGIGPSTALKIIEYRNKNGKFKTIDELKNISGIGESKFESIKEFIICY